MTSYNKITRNSKGMITAERTLEPIEIFIIEEDGSNADELLDWCEGELTATCIRPGARKGSKISGPDIAVHYNDFARPGSGIKRITGTSAFGRNSGWYAFNKDDSGLPVSVLYKRVSGQSILVASPDDIASKGYAL